ncbi:ABC transporter ATP-binding protein [Oceanirhabdus seepicola]|uniref:ABC transporter ATP-binding protein n=1 Tax=Oceanirhabdus seepicola TaxID=2828781 RepID=A0A9J6P4F3_9CLOT|nr:ABC transporter ATP-binding protein [Oceanirhabdus seepicola]MCM1991591.1 ABC transporter ATP-binding protein [Oceanirhabdus seepicola]
MNTNIIKVQNLKKKIGRTEIIKDITFQVKKGEICGFIGPNGAGKTTIMRLLTGLITPTGGKVYLNGVDVNKNREEALEKVGALVEAPLFFPYMTAEKLLLNLAILNKNMNKSERIEKVEEVLNKVGLYDRRKDKVSKYSLGMKQRLGIAQALLNKPEVVLLDEPANGLDPMGMIELRNLITKLNEEEGITFFISSHLLDELQKMCNNLLIIKEGKIIWSGNKEELLREEGYTESLEDAFVKLMMKA